MKEILKVVGAVIFDSQTDSFFLGQRSESKKHPLKWEFIGGKVKNESLMEAVEREFKEEVGAKIKAVKLLDIIRYDYGAEVGKVEVNFIECGEFDDDEINFDRDVYKICRWVERGELKLLDWIEADRQVALNLAETFGV